MARPSTSRQDEESRIVAHWLGHVENALGRGGRDLFSRALREARITRDAFKQARLLSQSQLDTVIRLLRADVPDITLRVMPMLRLLDLGLMGYAAASSESVGKAVDIVHSYHELTSDRHFQTLDIEGDWAFIRPISRLHFEQELIDIAEDALGGTCNLLDQLIGPDATVDWSQSLASFSYHAPPYVQSYHRTFRCPCQFDAQRTELRFPKKWLALPVATANSATAELCSAMCERVLGSARSRAAVVQTVSRLLISRPGRRMLRLEEAASEMRLSTSQLRKRLYSEDTSYKKVVLNVRMMLARHYVEATHLSIQDIAFLLDYAQPAPFSRAFKQYFGKSPQAYRQRG